mmetsp:Transcript_21261/g.56282  ORF Transcript_21261/g.56282 Transcript_21261/m.56282 type:complete len:224 (-) Transcript_21261:2012-2683(-)
MSIGFTFSVEQVGIMPSQAPPVQAIFGRRSCSLLPCSSPSLKMGTAPDFQSGSSAMEPGELPREDIPNGRTTFFILSLKYIPAPTEYFSGFELHFAFIAASCASTSALYPPPAGAEPRLVIPYLSSSARRRPLTTMNGTESIWCWAMNVASTQLASRATVLPARSAGGVPSYANTQGVSPAVYLPTSRLLFVVQPTVTCFTQWVTLRPPSLLTSRNTSVNWYW